MASCGREPASLMEQTTPPPKKMGSTYRSMCEERDMAETPVGGKRFSDKKNASLVPLGSCTKNSVISAPRRHPLFDTRGFASGRGGLSDEEIMAIGKNIYREPHPASLDNVDATFVVGSSHPGNTKSISQTSWGLQVHNRTAHDKYGGRSYWRLGEKGWHDCRSHTAFELGVQEWPRQQPTVARPNPMTRTESAPGGLQKTLVFGQGLRSTLQGNEGRTWRTLDGVVHVQEL